MFLDLSSSPPPPTSADGRDDEQEDIAKTERTEERNHVRMHAYLPTPPSLASLDGACEDDMQNLSLTDTPSSSSSTSLSSLSSSSFSFSSASSFSSISSLLRHRHKQALRKVVHALSERLIPE